MQGKSNILVINGGSSSIRFALYNLNGHTSRLIAGKLDRIGLTDCNLRFAKDSGKEETISIHRATKPIDFLLSWLESNIDFNTLNGIGHRVVHGMEQYEPQLVTENLLYRLSTIIGCDPEHLPREIEMMKIFHRRWPRLQQVACFDTAFHQPMPQVAKLLPIPRRLSSKGIRRYGFHGLSYTFLMEELKRVAGNDVANGRVILAHLGGGASMAAVKNGKSIDTSMGFTPASGLVMGTRCGDLDAGLIDYLMQQERLTVEELNNMLNHQSGLLGVSETSADMRDLLKIERSDTRAAEAIELFCYQAKKYLGAYMALLSGVDVLVFSGGIGENLPTIRERICEGLQYCGIELDPVLNSQNAAVISKTGARVSVRVMQTNEELIIAKQTHELLLNTENRNTENN